MNNLSGEKYNEMLVYGASSLKAQVDRINALNVFPVPDGDTGTNMDLTIQSGVKAISNQNMTSIGDISKAFSKGMLLGARGNSGVILSQFFRGLAEKLDGKDQVTPKQFQDALKQGRVRAYGSVIKAVEGTILTVITDMSKLNYKGKDFIEYFDKLIQCGQKSLDNTPNLLEVLKEVGVVDSGGAGLLEIFKGMQASLNGKEIEIVNSTNFETFIQTEEHPLNVDDIIYGYCTEMLIQLKKEVNINDVRSKLETLGDSIVAVEDDGILKLHVHTEDPIDVFSYGIKLGDIINVKSENMRIQAEQASGTKKAQENGIVIVASSRKMGELFNSIQPVEVIVGGQTLNPSTEDIIKAIKATNASNVLIFPNNSNIIMAAEAAKDILKEVNIKIVKTKRMTEGLECLINYNPSLNIEQNYENSNEVLNNIINYEITKSIRDTQINNLEIKNDDFIVIKDGDIVYSNKKQDDVLQFVIDDLDLDEIELLNFLLGEGSNKKIIKKLVKDLEDEYPFLEIEEYNTNQPVYSYLISAIKEQ